MDQYNHTVAIGQPKTLTYLTPAQVQKQLQIGEKLCYRLLKEEQIPSKKIESPYRIPSSWLEQVTHTSQSSSEQSTHKDQSLDEEKGATPTKDSRRHNPTPEEREVTHSDIIRYR